jgi:hypothetical protein
MSDKLKVFKTEDHLPCFDFEDNTSKELTMTLRERAIKIAESIAKVLNDEAYPRGAFPPINILGGNYFGGRTGFGLAAHILDHLEDAIKEDRNTLIRRSFSQGEGI